MADEKFTWTAFYEQLADKLLVFKSRRPSLIEALQKVYASINLKLPTLEVEGVPEDIDPFTVFALFNKGITDVNRRKIVAGMATAFGVGAPLPGDFNGVPVVNNLSATFYAFSHHDRGD
ncbi:MAG: hypothetical protein IKX75_08545, partial [Desulfovibrio sp.]|nr:hypothetical protein [Desulfovibrio sp.]